MKLGLGLGLARPPDEPRSAQTSALLRVAVRVDLAAVVLLALGLAFRLWLVLRGWPALDSDEAIVGLMARHILYLGERPIFFYGQHYMGALEAYLTAGVFRVFGPSTLSLGVGTLALTLGFLVCVYLLGRAAYARSVGLLTLALLVIGPAFGLLRELPAIGGYQETLLLAALIPLLVHRRLLEDPGPPPGWPARLRSLVTYACIGLAAGLGIWSDELVLPVVVLSIAALLVARPRDVLGLPAVALLAGTVLGGAPFWLFNLTHGGQTFAELAGANHTASLLAWAQQLGSTLSIGIPALLGSPHVCVAPGAVYAGYTSYPPAAVSVVGGPACAVLNGAYSLAILAVFSLIAAQLLRCAVPAVRHRFLARVGAARPDGAALADAGWSSPPLTRQRQAALWLRAILLLSALATVALYTLSPRTTTTDQFVVVRYLLPLYVALPLVVGCLWERTGPLVTRIARRGGVSRWSAALATLRETPSQSVAAGLLILFALFFAVGGVEVALTASDSAYTLPVPPTDAHLIHALDDLGVRAYYADYWTCYTLVFESGERLHCSTLGRVERYPPYAALLAATSHPAYVLHAGSSQDANFASYVAGQGHPNRGYTRVVVAGYAIYYVPGGQNG
jgi:hypothetical protein